MKHRMKWCELREYKWIEYVTIAVNRNLSNCKKARKKKRDFRASTGFEPLASALALQCSTSLSYEDPYTGGRPIYWVHQPVKGMKHRMKWCELREYKWIEYGTIAVNRNLSNCEKARKKSISVLSSLWNFVRDYAPKCYFLPQVHIHVCTLYLHAAFNFVWTEKLLAVPLQRRCGFDSHLRQLDFHWRCVLCWKLCTWVHGCIHFKILK